MKVFDLKTGRACGSVIRWTLIGAAKVTEQERFERDMRRQKIARTLIEKIAEIVDDVTHEQEQPEELIAQAADAIARSLVLIAFPELGGAKRPPASTQSLESPGIGADRRAGGERECAG